MVSSPPAFIIITGLSGAGKSTALKALEDAGFYGIDNLPVALLPQLLSARGRQKRHYALVMDTRDDAFLPEFAEVGAALRQSGAHLETLFLDADDQTLRQRYSAMRRRHPLGGISVLEAIRRERQALAAIRPLAAKIIDTSTMSPHRLASELVRAYGFLHRDRQLRTTLLSFGFKHGPPAEADVLFDVRFLPNPYFVAELKEATGLEPAVAAYVLESPVAREFMAKLLPLLNFLIPRYQEEGKAYLTIGIGCTGGKHRSVAVAEALRLQLSANSANVSVIHRELAF